MLIHWEYVAPTELERVWCCSIYKHDAPTELERVWCCSTYKHDAPNGAK